MDRNYADVIRRLVSRAARAALLAAFLLPAVSEAAWTPGGVPLSRAAGEQSNPRVVPDGAGGAIVTWMDKRSGNFDIYAQRVSASGLPLWAADGVPVATGPAAQRLPFVASDGAGGAVITWRDDRNGNLDLFAQRIDPSGQPLWAANGVPVCVESGQQQDTEIVAHGDGSVVIFWRDWRVGGAARLFAQRLNAAGQPMWTVNGVQIASAPHQYYVSIQPAGDGSYLLSWFDWRNANFDVFAQRLNANGTLAWTTNGVIVCTAPGDQVLPRMTSDGAGGSIITWYDARTGGYDIYAQRITGAGAVASGWPANGVAVCTAPNDQFEPVVVPDGANGAIVTWYDNRSTVGVYAHHILGSGVMDPVWPVNGVQLNTSPSTRPTIIPSGFGGAIVAWHGTPGQTNLDVVAQCVTADGVIQNGWPADGVMICVEPGDQSRPVGIDFGLGDALIVWSDQRSDAGDIYAQRVGAAFPNLNASVTPGSFSVPAVPRNRADAGINNAVLTPVLDGNTANTSLNWAVEVEGAGAVQPWTARLLLDGEPVSTMQIAGGAAAGSYQVLNEGPVMVRGGRHTLTVIADPDALVPESVESDNSWSGQFVWSPRPIDPEQPLLRAAPPEAGHGVEPNSDAFAWSPGSGVSWAVGMVPRDPGDDYDLRLYDDYSGSTAGLSRVVAASGGNGARSEFVVGRGAATPGAVYPAVVKAAGSVENEPFAISVANAAARVGTTGLEQWPGQVIVANRVADVYEGHFTAGQVYHLTLTKYQGAADMEFCIFPSETGLYNRDQAIARSGNLTENGGDVDVLAFTAPVTGTFPIAVYRATGADIANPQHYHFFWSTAVSGVGDVPRGGFRMDDPTPNPMTSSTRIRFSLPAPGPADLAIFDLSGRMVRRLPIGDGAADGEAYWDGTADDGRKVPAGQYWARLEAAGRSETRRISVLN